MGKSVDQSYEQAVKWYRLAANQGNAHAQFSLGLMYEGGNGVQQSYEDALELYMMAADKGFDKAQKSLGIMYEDGEGVEQSYNDALILYIKAANQGLQDALDTLADLGITPVSKEGNENNGQRLIYPINKNSCGS